MRTLKAISNFNRGDDIRVRKDQTLKVDDVSYDDLMKTGCFVEVEAEPEPSEPSADKAPSLELVVLKDFEHEDGKVSEKGTVVIANDEEQFKELILTGCFKPNN